MRSLCLQWDNKLCHNQVFSAMLEFKDSPRELMQALDRFLSVYYGDRQVEYKPDLDEIASWNIPQTLKDLYSFVGKYPGEHGILSTQDSLYVNSGRYKKYGGKIIIVSESNGCWECYTDTEGKDPPVWTMDYGWKEDSPKWKLVNNSLSQFLVTFCLIEASLASKYNRGATNNWSSCNKKPDKILADINERGHDAYLLWQGDCFENVIYDDEYRKNKIYAPDSFYSIEDAILIYWGCTTNYQNADRFLSSI